MFGTFRCLRTTVRYQSSGSFGQVSRNRDLVIQSGQAGVLMAVGDLVAQVAVEGRGLHEQSVSAARALRFLGLGCFMVGPSLFTWYRLLERCVGAATLGASNGARFSGPLLRQTVAKVALDQLVFAPAFLASFMTVLGTLQGNKWSEVERRLRSDYTEILINNWRLWPLVQLVNFCFVPLRYRILLVQTVAIFWNTYLSYKTNQPSALDDVYQGPGE